MSDQVIRGLTGAPCNIKDLHECSDDDDSATCYFGPYGRCQIEGCCECCEERHPSVDCGCAVNLYRMLYCDNPMCRVNTFECGETELCPGCGRFGEEVE